MKESPQHAGEWCTDVDDWDMYLIFISGYKYNVQHFFDFCSGGFLVAAVVDQVMG